MKTCWKPLLVTALLATACRTGGAEPEIPDTAPPVEHGLIVLGERLDDPYTVENVNRALRSLYPTRAERVDVTPTDLYVRFLPEDESDYERLVSLGVQMMDHPLDYRIVHYESPDHRGIDCALLCRRSTLPLRGSAPKHVPDSAGGVMATRDILLAEFDSLAILVNHHPSQLGGKADRRELAFARLRALTDSLHAAGQPRTLAVGDFNEDRWGENRRSGPANDERVGRNGKGTIKYNGKWEKIDGGFAEGFLRVREEVFDDPVLLEADKAFGGEKPRRTFVGPRYTGGVSDHLPVVFIVYY